MTGSGVADQADQQAAVADLRGLPDVASRVLGGSVLYANDEFYADAHPRPARHARPGGVRGPGQAV